MLVACVSETFLSFLSYAVKTEKVGELPVRTGSGYYIYIIIYLVVQVAKSLVKRARAVTTVSDSRRAGETYSYSPACLWGEAQSRVFRYYIYG